MPLKHEGLTLSRGRALVPLKQAVSAFAYSPARSQQTPLHPYSGQGAGGQGTLFCFVF